MKNDKKRILLHPWKNCEKHFLNLVEGKKADDIGGRAFAGFLREIQFLDESRNLTPKGQEYYHKKYIENNEDEATSILSDSLKASEPVVLITSVLWGCQGVSKHNIWRLLHLRGMIPTDTKPEDLRSYLMLLNRCNILDYSKKTNQITLKYNPRTETPRKTETRIIAPTTPYSNIRNLWECIRRCKEFLYWVDKHFSAKGLEPLAEELDGNAVKNVRMLLGNRANIDYERLRRDFKKFSAEMQGRGVKAECRVICDNKLLGDIHGRWIMGKDVCFNVPPINSIYKGQFDEIKLGENIQPLFIKWWAQALDIINDWQRIQPTLKK